MSATCREAAEAGFALPAAIFLLVVLAALGAFIAAINTTQTSSSSLDVLGTRAYQAARAGTEWGAFQVLRGTAVPGTTSPPAACFGATALSFPGTTLASFTTTVTCVRSATTEATTAPVTVDLITATACNDPVGGTTCPNSAPAVANYIERQVQVTIAQP